MWIYEDHCLECIYYLWEFVYELPEIPVSYAYFEILLVVYEMTDPLLGAPSQCHIHHPICQRMSYPCSDLGRFIISSIPLFIFSTSYLSFSHLSLSYVY